MTWNMIVMAPREKLGLEKIPRSSITPGIPQSVSDDVEFFIALRFSERARVIGYREDELLHIVWVDPKHEVYHG